MLNFSNKKWLKREKNLRSTDVPITVNKRVPFKMAKLSDYFGTNETKIKILCEFVFDLSGKQQQRRAIVKPKSDYDFVRIFFVKLYTVLNGLAASMLIMIMTIGIYLMASLWPTLNESLQICRSLDSEKYERNKKRRNLDK